MRFLIETHHPSDIHFWKFAICELQAKGHRVLVLSRDRDVMVDLLESYSWIEYKVISRMRGSNRFPLAEFAERQWGVARSIMEFRPNLVASAFGSYAQSAALLGVPNLIFTDSEFQHFNHKIAHPFATCVYTPDCFWKRVGDRFKWRRYRGYHELAFMRPERFQPDASGIEEALGCGLREYALFRLSAWNTMHDVGEEGIADTLDEIIAKVEGSGTRPVIVAEEDQLPEKLLQYRCPLPADRYHDVMAGAAYVITEGASTASEAACMGVYAIYVNSTSRGYLTDLEKSYGLVAHCATAREALEKVVAYAQSPLSEAQLQGRRQKMLDTTIDVSSFLSNTLIEEARSRAL